MQRTWIFLSIALAAIGAAFLINLSEFVMGSTPKVYLSTGDVEGMAVMHDRVLYTVGFEQQQELIEIINRAMPVGKKDALNGKKPNFSKLVIYRFDKPTEVMLQPIAYVKDDLVFTLSNMEPEQYLQDLSEGKFKGLIQKIVDQKD